MIEKYFDKMFKHFYCTQKGFITIKRDILECALNGLSRYVFKKFLGFIVAEHQTYIFKTLKNFVWTRITILYFFQIS